MNASPLIAYIWVALGGALGSVARFACVEWVQTRLPFAFPWGTLLVNVLGSFVIGVLAAFGEAHVRWQIPLLTRQFLMIGVLGGFTTFSSFSLQTLMLARAGAWLTAGINVAASVLLCIFAAWLGFALVSALARA